MNPFRRRRAPEGNPVRDTIDDPTEGCIFRFMLSYVTLVHIVESIFGLVLIGYALALVLKPKDPQHAFSIVLEMWASLFVTSGILGVMGSRKEREYCKRAPLKISGTFLGPVKLVVSLLFFFIFLIQKDELLRYFREKHEELYLSLDFIQFLENRIVYVYFFFLLIAFFEFVRFSFIRTLRDAFLLRDDARRQGLLRQRERDANEWDGDQSDTSIGNSNLTTPLISGDNNDNGGDNKFDSKKSSNSSWWEVGEDGTIEAGAQYESSNFEDAITEIPHNKERKKGLLSSLRGKLSRASSASSSSSLNKKNAKHTQSNKMGDNISTSDSTCSDNAFAPIEGDIEMNAPSIASDDYDEYNTPSWLKPKNDDDVDKNASAKKLVREKNDGDNNMKSNNDNLSWLELKNDDVVDKHKPAKTSVLEMNDGDDNMQSNNDNLAWLEPKNYAVVDKNEPAKKSDREMDDENNNMKSDNGSLSWLQDQDEHSNSDAASSDQTDSSGWV